MTRYAESTEVSPSRSREEIERTLIRYQASAFSYGWERGRAALSFVCSGRQVRFVLPMPDRNSPEFTLTPAKAVQAVRGRRLQGVRAGRPATLARAQPGRQGEAGSHRGRDLHVRRGVPRPPGAAVGADRRRRRPARRRSCLRVRPGAAVAATGAHPTGTGGMIMENPNTWGPLEHAIDEALYQVEKNRRGEVMEHSDVRQIADHLRSQGLVDKAPIATEEQLRDFRQLVVDTVMAAAAVQDIGIDGHFHRTDAEAIFRALNEAQLLANPC